MFSLFPEKKKEMNLLTPRWEEGTKKRKRIDKRDKDWIFVSTEAEIKKFKEVNVELGKRPFAKLRLLSTLEALLRAQRRGVGLLLSGKSRLSSRRSRRRQENKHLHHCHRQGRVSFGVAPIWHEIIFSSIKTTRKLRKNSHSFICEQ